ncbi:MAG: hypothetical protein KDH96_13775, partial [Candidatus Riesia sp.]|nr:hypothetical protein [Candidatus Riesia sp.]
MKNLKTYESFEPEVQWEEEPLNQEEFLIKKAKDLFKTIDKDLLKVTENDEDYDMKWQTTNDLFTEIIEDKHLLNELKNKFPEEDEESYMDSIINKLEILIDTS